MAGRGADAVLVLVVRRGEPLRLREVERSLGVARIEREGRAEVLAGGVEVADGGMDDAGIVVDLGGDGVELDRSARLRHRLVLPAQLDQRSGEPRPHLGIVRRERRRLAQGMFRADQIVHVQQRAPEIEVGGGVARVVGEGGLVARDRLLPLVAFLKQVAEAVVGDGDGGVPSKKAAVQVDSQVGTAALACDRRQQMHRVGLFRRRIEHPPGEPLRFAQVPGAVCVEGTSQPSIDAGRPCVGPRAKPLAARCSALPPSAHAAVRRVSGAGPRTPAASDSGRSRP